MTRRSPAGWALAAAGGALAYSGLRSTGNGTQQSQNRPELGSNILVNASPEEAFRFWRDLENAPRFMNHIESVSDLGDGRSRWSAVGPMGAKLHWTAEITDEREGEYIAWRSLPGSDLDVTAASNSSRLRESAGPPSTPPCITGCQSRLAQCGLRLRRTAGELFHAAGPSALQGADRDGRDPDHRRPVTRPALRNRRRSSRALNPDRPLRGQWRGTEVFESMRRVS